MVLAALHLPDFYLLAALLGSGGQLIRAALGLLKAFRTTGVFGFNGALFGMSLGLGAVSGLIGSLVYDLQGRAPATILMEELANDRNFLLMAIAAGYFGADVIEGVLGKHAPARKSDR